MPMVTRKAKPVPNAMHNSNAFKLGLFSMNCNGGGACTTVENRWRCDWDDMVAAAQLADDIGLEFILPIARWKGYGGTTDVRGESMETLTFAAGLAALTKRISVFSTVHLPLVHPVFAAKALATVDHISNGRAGLNMVCGWNQGEFDMFGQKQLEHDTRYDQGEEWYDILYKIFNETAPFDYDGQYYQLKGVAGAPGPIQKPRPFTMSAAMSPAGRRFAARTSDMLFTGIKDKQRAPEQIAELRGAAAEFGRDVGVFTACHVVCRETDAEAQEYYRYYAEEMADQVAVDIQMKGKLAHYKDIDPDALKVDRRRYAGGSGTSPLVGSPETIAREMAEIRNLGFDGTTLSFVNYVEELPFFAGRVLPLLEEAGLRSSAADTGPEASAAAAA
ncbi:LLM class flavin-dependent oxidoreductase [Sphingopyxis sp. LARHCG72]